MKLIILLLATITAQAATQALSYSEYKLLYDFTNRAQQAKKYADMCLLELTNYKEEGISCVTFQRKIRILNNKYVQINRFNTIELNKAISSSIEIDKGFALYFTVVQIHTQINKKLKF